MKPERLKLKRPDTTDVVVRCQQLVRRHFIEEALRTADLWFNTPNSGLLGGFVPNDMIRMGRELKLLRIIENALEENEPPPRVAVIEPKPKRKRRTTTRSRSKTG